MGLLSNIDRNLVPLVAIALPFLIFGMVVLGIFIYRMWASIQDGQTRPTPGLAVGLLFVPLFNFY